jgi:hypothetical protein
MKKFMIGIVCGVFLSFSSVVAASEAIQAILFPSKVIFHVNNSEKQLDGAKDDPILSYNNKAYIPLRTFAEAMGATVAYESASVRADGKHKIDITPSMNWTLLRAPEPIGMCRGFPMTITVNHVENEGAPSGVVPIDKPSTFHVQLFNYTEGNMVMKPVNLDFEVYTMDPATGGMGTLVYSRPLPALTGLVPSQLGYEASITWDQKGLDGKQLPPAKYMIQVKRPSELSYTLEGSSELKTVRMDTGMGCNLNYFGIEFK